MTLKRKTLVAGRWAATSAVFRSAVQFLQTVILARLFLTPADFGLMATVAALLAVIGLFANFGLSRAIIHYPTPAQPALSSLYWANNGFAVLLMLLLAAGAPWLAGLYEEPALTPIIIAASAAFPLSALGQQLRTLAEKRLEFRLLAQNEIASVLIGFALALYVGASGGGVFALVSSLLAASTCSSLFAWLRLSDGFRPSLRLRLAEIRPFFRFGSYLTGESFVNTLRMQSDIFIGSLLLGPQSIGVYTLAREICLRISGTINPVATRIGFPVMASVQSDRGALASIYLHTLRMTASVNFPIYAALGIFSEEIVALLLGPEWRQAGLYLSIFAAWGLVRSAGNPVGSLLHASGRVRLALIWNVALLLVLPPLFLLATRLGGLEGLAWSMLVAQLLVFVPAWHLLIYPTCGIGLAQYGAQLLPALAAALIAGIVGWAAASPLQGDAPRLGVGLVAGGTAYLALSLWLNRAWLATVFELVRHSPSSAGPK